MHSEPPRANDEDDLDEQSVEAIEDDDDDEADEGDDAAEAPNSDGATPDVGGHVQDGVPCAVPTQTSQKVRLKRQGVALWSRTPRYAT